MNNEYVYTGADAIDYLCKFFSERDPGKKFDVSISLHGDSSGQIDKTANISIAGLNEAKRKETGKLENVSQRNGSVFLYGDDTPNYFMALKTDGKTNAFSLENAAVQPAGFAESLLRVTSPKWPKVSAIDIRIAPVITGETAANYFESTILKKIRSEEYSCHLGKWVSKKVYDRSLSRVDSDRLAIEEAVKKPESELLNTMAFGADTLGIEYKRGDNSKDIPHKMSVRQQHNSTKLDFVEFIIEPAIFGREIGAKQTVTSYVYLIGTSFQAPSNLLIIRHGK